ncbi:MAG: serine hydrolase [Candidatus Magasanikbacteria bacterium]|nr:serine hydrolase [Candidatus Magasanikbacteria bacterium]
MALISLVFLPHNSLLNNSDNVANQKALAEAKKKAAQERKLKQDPLLAELNQKLSINDQYAVSIFDISNSEKFGISETKSFHSASVTKILVATAALQGVESGKYSLEQQLGAGTFKYQLQQMINQSKNNSWDLFNNLIGFNGEQKVADQLGLKGVDMNQTRMTTDAVAQLLLSLYKGKALRPKERDLLFSYMQNTETENRISPAIPKGISFYHKTGSFGGELHDAAIVIHPKNPFVLVIFTVDSKGTSWGTRFASFQKATNLVYSYFDSI